MPDWLCASTVTAADDVPVIVAPVTIALDVDVTALIAEAPAPENATPTIPPAIATEAAMATALMVDRVA